MFNRTQISNGSGGEYDEHVAAVETGGLAEIDMFHFLIHKGYFNCVCFYKAGQATTAISNICFTVPETTSTDKRAGIHGRLDIAVSGGVKVDIQEVENYTGGTEKIPYNMNSHYYNGMKSSFVTDATIVNGATKRIMLAGGDAVGSGKNAIALSGIPENIFKPGKWALVITPLVNGTIFDIQFYVYERYL